MSGYFDLKCRVDGQLMGCAVAAGLAASGAAEACPDNECSKFVGTAYVTYRAYADGFSGYLTAGERYRGDGVVSNPYTERDRKLERDRGGESPFFGGLFLLAINPQDFGKHDPPPTDCQRFANEVEKIAKAMGLHLIRADDLSGAVQKFMDKLATRFTEFTGASYLDAGRAVLGSTNEHFNPIEFGSSGFAAPYFEPDAVTSNGVHHPSNQVRHSVGGLIVGYVRGEAAGLRQMNGREDPNDQEHGVPDIHLNGQTVPMGASIAGADGHIHAATLGQWIRDTLCTH
jgi:hypothetical protein